MNAGHTGTLPDSNDRFKCLFEITQNRPFSKSRFGLIAVIRVDKLEILYFAGWWCNLAVTVFTVDPPMKKCFVLFLVFLARCAAADDAPIDGKYILQELKQLQAKQSEMSKAQVTSILQAFSAAASSNGAAIAFYEEAIKAVRFEGGKRGDPGFAQWKKRDADRLKTMQTAVRLHLEYLVLSVQRATNVPLATLEQPLLNYTNEVSALHNEISNQDLMKESVAGSVFVQWYGLDKLFENLKEWELVPENVDGIFDKTLLPLMRAKKDPRVIQYWDAKLIRRAQEASWGGLAIYAEQFNAIERPAILWSRAQDLLAIGQRNKAVTEMLSVIKDNPKHLSAGAWISELSTIVSGSTVAAQPAQPTQPTQNAAAQ
jgi:hypothetical protein